MATPEGYHVPHASGDEPNLISHASASKLMFPTRVGMNRCAGGSRPRACHVPHASGDEPARRAEFQGKEICSPREWG